MLEVVARLRQEHPKASTTTPGAVPGQRSLAVWTASSGPFVQVSSGVAANVGPSAKRVPACKHRLLLNFRSNNGRVSNALHTTGVQRIARTRTDLPDAAIRSEGRRSSTRQRFREP